MRILTANSKTEAQSLNDKAFAYIVAEQGANGTRWSDVLTNGTIYGIIYDDSVRQAFTQSELLGVVIGERARMIDGEVVGEWEVSA